MLPPNLSWADNVYWLFTILIDEEKFGVPVCKLAEALKSNGIDTRWIFYPMHTQPLYVNENKGSFPCAERLNKMGLSLPSSPDLTSDDVISTCVSSKHSQRAEKDTVAKSH